MVKNNMRQVWKVLDDRETKVTVQIAPAVRVAVSREFGLPAKENAAGFIVAALRRLGFDEAWIQICEKHPPKLLSYISTCRSPMQMFASIIQEETACTSSRPHVHVAVIPCTAKKFEAARDEFKTNGKPQVNFVLTTQELIRMIKEAGILFSELTPEAVDMPFGTITGAGVIFGVTGGVTEAVIRRISSDKSPAALIALSFSGIRGMEGVKTVEIKAGERNVNIAVVSGLKNAQDLIEKIESGEMRFDFVEVMACPGGCIAGAG
jgi:NADH-quinone oxidoreductase subunit G